MFRRLFFGLGVLLGIVEPSSAPELLARVWRSGEAIYLNAELVGAFPPGAMELAAQGTEVAFLLRAEVEGGGPPVELIRGLRFDAVAGEWVVRSRPGPTRRLASAEVAVILAGKVEGIKLGDIADPGLPVSLRVSVRSGILDGAGAWHEAGILWGYAVVERGFAFSGAVEIPR